MGGSEISQRKLQPLHPMVHPMRPGKFAFWTIAFSIIAPLAIVCCFFKTVAVAQEEAQPADQTTAFLVRVPLPLVGNVDQTVRRHIQRLITNVGNTPERPVLVLEFWPPEAGKAGLQTEFERGLALARFLSGDDLNGVRTVAWLPRTVIGHAVLPVLACEEIVMHPAAELGAAGEGESRLSAAVRASYTEVANRRRTIPEALALGMLDKNLEVLRATTTTGTRYVLSEELEQLKEETAVQSVDTVVRAGQLARIPGSEARLKFGFVSRLAGDRRELATKLEIPADALQPDPAAGDGWRPIRIEFRGPVNNLSVDRCIRSIQAELKTGDANLICLMISSPGGSPESALRLAGFLADLDSSRVRTIAYVEDEALADAAFVAIACDQLVMESEARLGGAGAYQPSPEQIADLRQPIRSIATNKSRSWSLPVALIDPGLEVAKCELKGTNIFEYFSEAERLDQPQPDRWIPGAAVTEADRPLQLVADRAEQLGVARYAVEDFAEFQSLYDLEGNVELVEPTWVDELIAFLAQPHIASTLLFIAGFALMVELSSPGVGVGGFVAAVAAGLYFWSQYLHGTAGMLEVTLFVLGVACVLTEIFLLPGFGIFGLGGGALIVASLVLASQTFVIPRNEYQFQQLPRSLMVVVAAMGGVMAGLFFLRKFLHRTPGLRRVVLNPPEVSEKSEAMADFDDLLGQIGQAATPLVPSGKARFGDRLIDVVADGSMVEKGGAVRVAEVYGNRVVVEPMDR